MEIKQARGLNPAATLYCLGFLICWTAGPVYIKLFSEYLDAWTQNAIRYAAACLFWMPFLIWTRYTNTLEKGIFRRALVPSIMNVISQSCWAGCMYYANPAFISLLSKTIVFWVPLLSMIEFRDERALLKSRAFWIGMALSMAGLAGVVMFQENFSIRATLPGLILVTVFAITWSAYTVMVRRTFGNTDARMSFSVITIYTTLGLGALSFLFGRPEQLLDLQTRVWVHVVISAISAVALGHVFYYAAMRRIGATIPALVTLLTPFCILLVSGVLFQEHLTSHQWIFGLVLIAGTGFSLWAQKDFEVESPAPAESHLGIDPANAAKRQMQES